MKSNAVVGDDIQQVASEQDKRQRTYKQHVFVFDLPRVPRENEGFPHDKRDPCRRRPARRSRK